MMMMMMMMGHSITVVPYVIATNKADSKTGTFVVS